jgi:hypothetical protein
VEEPQEDKRKGEKFWGVNCERFSKPLAP